MITGDWQAELGGVTVGAGTLYVLTGPITGLGVPTPRSSDNDRGNQPGAVAAPDVPTRRVLTVPVGCNGSNPEHGWWLLEQLKAAWAPSAGDVAFDVRLPGFAGARRFYGRPRGLEDDLTLLRTGFVPCLGTFEALDPYGYGPAVEGPVAGVVPFPYPGSAPSDRWTLTVEATGGGPVVFSTGDSEPPLTLTAGPGATVIVDGRTRTIVDTTGADRYDTLTPGSGWPLFTPTMTAMTLTGATGTLTLRPAYL